MKIKSVLLATFGLLAAHACALAASTVDPSQPPLHGPLNSAPVRNNFLATYTDLNNILGVFAGNTAPLSPTDLQSWADKSASPVIVFKYWNQANSVWIPYAILNISSNTFTPYFTSGGYMATAPITVSVSGGIATFGLAKDSNFATVGGALAFASIANGSLLARCAGSSGEPTACTWPNYAAQAIGSTNGIFPHYVSGAWTTDTTGVSGHAVPFLDGSNLWSAPQVIYLGTATLRASLTGMVQRGAQLDGASTISQLDSFGAAGAFACMRSDGTAAVSTALQTNDLICGFGAHGYDGTANSSVAAALRLYAAQAWTGSAHGAFARIATTPNGSTTPVDQFGIEQDGGATLPPTVTGGSKGVGTLNISGNYYVGGNQIAFSNLAGQATLAQLPTIGANTALGSLAGGTPIALSQAQLTTLINPATASLSGAIPAWPNNTTTFFRGDGSYAGLNFAAMPTLAADNLLGNPSGALASMAAVPLLNCTGALTYSTGTHTFGCNVTAGTGTVTSAQIVAGTGISVSGTCTITTSGACTVTNTGLLPANNLSDVSNPATAISNIGGCALAGCTMTGLLTTNGQVKFPVTANPSSDANTLDDYREGSWTPTVTFGGASVGVAYSQQGGSYTKIGQLVVARFNIVLTAKGSSTGGAAIGGLPFTFVAGLGGWLLSSANMSSWAATYFDPQPSGIANVNLITTTGTVQASNTNFTNTSALFGVIVFAAQ